MTRQINEAGLELIKSREGFRADPYQDIGGVWTIGYGHTQGVTEDTNSITEEQAEAILLNDLTSYENAIDSEITADLTDNQFSALVSLVYNVGTRPLFMTLGHLLNQGKYDQAANEFLCWNHVGGKVVDGLTKRREAERKLFLTT